MVAAVVCCTTANPSTKAVLVKTIYGDESFYVIVPSYSESVSTTKALIAKHISVPAVDQALTYANEDMVNSQSLSYYGVGNTANPTLFVAKRVDSVAEGSTKLNMVTIHQGTTAYYINLPNQDSTTVLQVKEIVAKRTGWAAADLVIQFGNAKLIEDSYTMDNYGVNQKENPVLFVSRPRFGSGESVAVKVYSGSEFFEMRAGTEENIGSVKEQIRTELKTARHVSLAFGVTEITNDAGTLLDYHVGDIEDPVLHATFKRGETSTDAFVLIVHQGEKRFQILTSQGEKVIDAKHNIERIVGIPAVDQTLSFAFNELQNELTMYDQGIYDGYSYVVHLSKES